MPPNPFTPTFGSSPPLLVGRDALITEFSDSLDDGPGAPGRATLYTGVRGVGKTALLNAVQDEARTRGWVVIAETATAGLIDRVVTQHLPALLNEHSPAGTKRRKLTGITAPGNLGGATWDTTDAHPVTVGLRNQIEVLTDILANHQTGLLITVDEIHREQTTDLIQLGAVLQHAFRENRDVAFVGAGLPSVVSDLLNERVLTFLRRADRHVLGLVDPQSVATALRNPIERTGRAISDDACDEAVLGTGGYPFLIQMVGYRIWQQNRQAHEITLEDVRRGVAAARRRTGQLVHEPSLSALSDIDKSFLAVMARNDGPTRTADIAAAFNDTTNYVNQYRRRLIAAELIEPAGRGRVDFAIPSLREYLREHAAAIPLRNRHSS